MDRARIQRIVTKLHETEPTFDWVGVYWVDGQDLALGPFEGNPTEHVRIRIPEGVCGSVAASGRTEVVPDVRNRPGHIACDIDTRSEVVAPIIRDGTVLGVLDIDSNTIDAFDGRDVLAIEAAAEEIAAS